MILDVTRLGWTVSGPMVFPVPPSRPATGEADLALLSRMVEYVMHLEAPVVAQVLDNVKEKAAEKQPVI